MKLNETLEELEHSLMDLNKNVQHVNRVRDIPELRNDLDVSKT